MPKPKKKIRYSKTPIQPREKKDRLILNEVWLKGRRNPRRSWDIKLGDEVILLSGDQKGATGKVLAIFPQEAKVIVEGINVQTRHLKRPGEQEGRIVSKPGKIWISKVALFVQKDGKNVPTRLRHNSEGKRVAVKTGEIIE